VSDDREILDGMARTFSTDERELLDDPHEGLSAVRSPRRSSSTSRRAR
jgi:hypothetical protein